MADGWITIGTEVDTKKFDKQIQQLENKMKQTEQKKIQIDTDIKENKEKIFNIENAEQEIKNYSKEIKDLQQQIHNFYKEKPEQAMGKSPELEEMRANLDKTISKRVEMIQLLDREGGQLDILKEKLASQEAEQSALNTKLNEYSKELTEVNMKKEQFVKSEGIKREKEAVANLKNEFNGVGSSIQNAIHKVTKLALGVFGVRSAFMLLRRASSEFASYNPQYAANLEYIRYALTQLIAPVLEYIVNLARTLLAYINYIANAWFGVNLFAKASAKSFNQVKNNIGGASSAAKELQKTLAGFDEMNILNSSSTGGGGGVGGALSPDFDLSDLEDIEIPDWIKWIAENKDVVVGAIKAIAEAFLVFKVLQIAKILSGIKGSIFDVISGLTTFKKFLLGLGIALIIAGVVLIVESLINWLKDPTWNNFKGVLYGLETAAAGLATVLISLNASNPLGWIILAVDAIAFLITLVADLTVNLNDEERKTKAVQEAEENLKKAREDLKNATDDYINAVEKAEDAEKKLKEAQDETGISIDDLLDYMDKENKTFKDLDENQRKVYKAYINNNKAQDNLKTSTDNLTQSEKEQTDKLYDLIKTYGTTASSAEDYRDKVVQAYKDGKISAKEAADAIGMSLAGMSQTTQQEFTKNIPNAIKEGLDPNNYQNSANAFNNWWAETMNQAQRKSTSVFSTIGSTIQRTLASANNIKFGTSTGFSSGGYVTKMASGGIINMPNKGVPVTSAIAGEAGHEGIIPLTDSQAMAQLGAEIGRNVLVNLTNVMTMNGRIISRELKNIQNEQDFAYNG